MEIDIIKEYYDKHTKAKLNSYVEGNLRVERAFREIVTWFVNDQKDVLEIGCGIGSVAYRLSESFPQSNIKAFDISPKSIEIATKLFQNKNLTFFCADEIEKIDFESNQKFDIIYLIDVFEHLPEKPNIEVASFILNKLTDDGIVFMSCPTPKHQEWLRKNKPEGLQPVDLDISMEFLFNFSKKISRRILYYKELCVWSEGDYFHIVFGNRPLCNRVYSNGIENNLGIKTAIKNKVEIYLNSQIKQIEKRRRIVKKAFPEFNPTTQK